MPIIKLHKDFLIEELNLPESAISDKHLNSRRWSETREIVFEHGGKFYSTTYSQRLTEMQDESPWEYEKEVECVEVELIEKTIKVWSPKKD